jgi:hypothetical protein
MIDLRLVNAAQASKISSSQQFVGGDDVLLHSRRSALLPMQSGLVVFWKRLIFLPYYVWSSQPESYILTVPLATAYQHRHAGSSGPLMAHVEIIDGQDIQTYSAVLDFDAGRQYTRRILSWLFAPAVLVLATIIWIAEMVCYTLVMTLFHDLFQACRRS